MRIAIVLLVGLVAAVSASANPTPEWPTLFFDFDEDGVPDSDVQLSTYPPAFTIVEAYVALACSNAPGEEFTTISFMLADPMVEYPGIMGTRSFTPLLPGGLAIGDAFAGGITVASTECMIDPIVYIGKVSMFYLGGACHIKILDHPEYSRWVVDCQEPGEVVFYCDLAWGGIGTVHQSTGEDCESPLNCMVVPVEDVSWGAIKSLYW